MSVLADKIGRKIIIVVTLMIATVGGLCNSFFILVIGLGAIYNVFPLLYIGQLMMGFGGYALSIVSFIYLG